MSSTTPDRPRLLVLIKGLGSGGAEQLIVDGADHWDRDYFDYRVAYILPWKDHLVPQLIGKGVEVVCLGGRRGLGVGAAYRLFRLCRELRPDVIHSHLPAAGILARFVSRRPHVYTEHNIASSYRQPTRFLNRLSYGRNRAVIAVSDAVASSVAAYPGKPPIVIPNGVSFRVAFEEAASARAEMGMSPGDPLVVHVGNIRPHKGHANLIAATSFLRQARPDARVVSIGGEKNPGDLDRLERAASAAGVADRIRFLGRRTDARAFLAAADVVVNPSDVEGLPVSILEALALARPVVATDVGGVSSVVRTEETGLLVPRGDPESLAAGVVMALESQAAADWGRAGQRLVDESYGLARMVRDYESVYRGILGD
jgi:glycosyltransferase involved in cell wall biosynthesis